MTQINHTDSSLWRDRNLRVIFGVTLSAVMGVSLITPVFPQIVRVFDIEREQVTLLITIFTLPGLLFAPLYGILADRWGRKKVLAPLLFLYGIAGAACGFARDFNILLLLRFLQGIGSAGLFTLNNTIIGDLFEGRKQLAAMGMNAAVVSIGAASYPAVGGLLARFHWSVPFFLPLAAIIVGFAVMFILQSPEPAGDQTFHGYISSAFKEILHWRILRLFILSFITFSLAFGPLISFVPLWMAEQFNSKSAIIGIVLSSGSLTAAFSASRLGWLGQRLSIRTILSIAFLIYTVALGIVPHLHTQWWMFAPAIAYGFAQGMNIPSVQTLILRSASLEYRGALMAINSTIILMGITTGPLLASIASRTVGMVGLYRIGSGAALLTALILILSRVWIKTEPPDSPMHGSIPSEGSI